MISDYYFVRKGYLQTSDLYSAQKSGPYFYTFGFHWRGYAAYIAGILINVVGFAGAVGTPVPVGATYSKCFDVSRYEALLTLCGVYNLNFFCGFIVAAGVYYLLCWVSHIPATSDHWLEVDEDATGRNASLVYGIDGSDTENGYEHNSEEFKSDMKH